MPKVTRHINKGYRYAQGGAVRGKQTTPDDPDYDFDDDEGPGLPVSEEMVARSHKAPPGGVSTAKYAAGHRESTNIEDQRAMPKVMVPEYKRPPLQQAHDRFAAVIEGAGIRDNANREAAKSGMQAYKWDTDKNVDDTIRRVSEKPTLGPPRVRRGRDPLRDW